MEGFLLSFGVLVGIGNSKRLVGFMSTEFRLNLTSWLEVVTKHRARTRNVVEYQIHEYEGLSIVNIHDHIDEREKGVRRVTPGNRLETFKSRLRHYMCFIMYDRQWATAVAQHRDQRETTAKHNWSKLKSELAQHWTHCWNNIGDGIASIMKNGLFCSTRTIS